MSNPLRFDVAEQRIRYTGGKSEAPFNNDQIWEFNHRHSAVLGKYDVTLDEGSVIVLCDKLNQASNLGVLRNRKLRESAILSAALSAVGVALTGRGKLNSFPVEQQNDKTLINALKRDNDRTAALIMSEVLQVTTDTLPIGEEVLIESTITEGVRVKHGKELGGNPTIAVGALFGKKENRHMYGLPMSNNISLLSMGNDVIEGTTKSVTGQHSSMTAMFLTESNVKRHLPDVYVQRWMSGARFEMFNPREVKLVEAAEIIAKSYGGGTTLDDLSAFFLERNRHLYAMETLNKANVATPYDKDGDLFPSVVLGHDGVRFPNGRALNSIIGEIGGSAEWAVGVLPLVWRGGQALGMLTSQSGLTRTDLSPQEKWRERFHFTEEEFMLIQDARFEHKPYFTIHDILEDPFAGGIAVFGGITDNYFVPSMEGVRSNPDKQTVTVCTTVVNSLGLMEMWRLTFRCNAGIAATAQMFTPPKDLLTRLTGSELERTIGDILAHKLTRKRYRLFFNNEYYPALIPVRDKMVLLHKAIDGLIERGALDEHDREIVKITQRLASEWFVGND